MASDMHAPQAAALAAAGRRGRAQPQGPAGGRPVGQRGQRGLLRAPQGGRGLHSHPCRRVLQLPAHAEVAGCRFTSAPLLSLLKELCAWHTCRTMLRSCMPLEKQMPLLRCMVATAVAGP